MLAILLLGSRGKEQINFRMCETVPETQAEAEKVNLLVLDTEESLCERVEFYCGYRGYFFY